MSKLYITEHRNLFRSDDGHIMQIPGDYGIDQAPLDFTSGAQTSAAFQLTTRFVGLSTDAACSISFGPSPGSTTNNRRLPANFFGYFPVMLGAGDKISVVANS